MTAQPAYLAVHIYRGDPWSMTFSSMLDGAVEVVTAADALAQIRTTADAADPTAAMTVAVAGGAVTLSLTATQTGALNPGTYVWDFQPAPTAETWLAGAVTVVGDVSRAA